MPHDTHPRCTCSCNCDRPADGTWQGFAAAQPSPMCRRCYDTLTDKDDQPLLPLMEGFAP